MSLKVVVCHFREALRIKFLYSPSVNLALKTVRGYTFRGRMSPWRRREPLTVTPFADNVSALTHAFPFSVSLYFLFCSFSPPFLPGMTKLDFGMKILLDLIWALACTLGFVTLKLVLSTFSLLTDDDY